ncbi:hypothetical protein [Corynebacterium bovis]|uniref:hypothetical protein n=1 Tax=Corynebacterium bovis TaxID=36808 RepID=UPI000F64DF52|nr:hypothetical protein [Corynebacterium bovis]
MATTLTSLPGAKAAVPVAVSADITDTISGLSGPGKLWWLGVAIVVALAVINGTGVMGRGARIAGGLFAWFIVFNVLMFLGAMGGAIVEHSEDVNREGPAPSPTVDCEHEYSKHCPIVDLHDGKYHGFRLGIPDEPQP